MILFIHGFASSNTCSKCVALQKFYPDTKILTLDLVDVTSSLEALEKDIEKIEIIIGASLGGFYAHYLAKKHQKKVLLINPVHNPFLLMHAADFSLYDKERVMKDFKQMYAYTNEHSFVKPVEVLFGLNDDIIDCDDNYHFFSEFSCKFYEDDHRLLVGFKDYLCYQDTLLYKSLLK